MVKFLSLSGVGSYLQLPTMTIKKIVIDGYFPTQTGDLKMLFDAQAGQTNGYVYARLDGSVTSAGANFTVTNYARNVRRVVEFNAVNNIDGNGNFTDDVTIFANKTFGENFTGLLYDVKCYNALGALVAHYDMNTGTTQDQTGNGRHATMSGGTWLDDTKTYYLSMDGINDYLQTPSLTFTECIMEFSATPGGWRTYFDAQTGIANSNFTRNDSGQDFWGSGISSVYKDGVLQTSGTNGFVNATRATYRIVLPSVGTDNVNIFANQLGTGTTTVQGKLYNLKFYNAAALVAHVDFTKGHLIDLSGNGKMPTLTGGGTWVEDVAQGLDGQQLLSLTNKIYKDDFRDLSLINQLYKDNNNALNFTNVLFKDNQSLLSLNNVIYKDSQTLLNLIQSIYVDGSATLDLIQSIFDASSTFVSLDLKQVIYQDSNITLNTLQTIYRDTQSSLNTIQQMYEDNSIDLSLILEMRNDIYVYKQLLETIFKINKQLETKVKLQREVNTTFKINKDIEIVFKI